MRQSAPAVTIVSTFILAPSLVSKFPENCLGIFAALVPPIEWRGFPAPSVKGKEADRIGSTVSGGVRGDAVGNRRETAATGSDLMDERAVALTGDREWALANRC